MRYDGPLFYMDEEWICFRIYTSYQKTECQGHKTHQCCHMRLGKVAFDVGEPAQHGILVRVLWSRAAIGVLWVGKGRSRCLPGTGFSCVGGASRGAAPVGLGVHNTITTVSWTVRSTVST